MYGLNVHKAVLEAGEEYSGCTAHVVDNEYDHGPILAQSRVPVLPDDTPTSLAARVQEAERAMYPAVIDSYLKNLTPFPVKW
jgi:phosphoribosylglycinamide formyltransferase-1